MKKNPLKPDDMWKGASSHIFINAKKLRESQTEAEGKLWLELRGNQIEGFKFRRQHPLGLYVVDFYCHALRLVIEIDGEYHFTQEQKMLDENRTKDIEFQGLKVIRFTNQEVLNELSKVVEKIKSFIKTSSKV
jgi:very-short-patch-repair endonuclease|nr:endonuclease domain-containing protein [uncultured Flavobacterium sp.]